VFRPTLESSHFFGQKYSLRLQLRELQGFPEMAGGSLEMMQLDLKLA
jgi:hypothetical protein